MKGRRSLSRKKKREKGRSSRTGEGGLKNIGGGEEEGGGEVKKMRRRREEGREDRRIKR